MKQLIVKRLHNKKLILISFFVCIIPMITACSSSNEFENLTMNTDYNSVRFEQTSYETNKTITKLIVTLRNTGKKPVYVNGKFIFSIVTVANQRKAMHSSEYADSFISKVPAQKMSYFASLENWTSVDGVFLV
jgi:azurin